MVQSLHTSRLNLISTQIQKALSKMAKNAHVFPQLFPEITGITPLK
jgi:hypothetical protein